MSQPDLIHIALSQLGISKLNMRHGRNAPDVSDILPSIREKGIRQTLLVRREAGGFGIVAGRRAVLCAPADRKGKRHRSTCALRRDD